MSSVRKEQEDEKISLNELKEEFSLLRTEIKLLREEMKQTNKTTKEIIKLNVGGTCFQTLEDTLISEKGTFFISMLQKGFKIEENEFFIDRDPKWFPFVLNFLRKGKTSFEDIEPEGKDDKPEDHQVSDKKSFEPKSKEKNEIKEDDAWDIPTFLRKKKKRR